MQQNLNVRVLQERSSNKLFNLFTIGINGETDAAASAHGDRQG